MARTTYELFDNTGAGHKSMGKVWWDGKLIRSNKPELLPYLREHFYAGKSFDDGEEFLEVLPSLFKNGYISVKKVTE